MPKSKKASVKAPKVRVRVIHTKDKGVQTAEDRWNLSSRLRPETPNVPNEHLILDLAAAFGRNRGEIAETLLLYPRNVDCITDDAQRLAVCAWLGMSEPSESDRVAYVKDQMVRSSTGGEAWLKLLRDEKLANRKAYHELRFKRLDEQVGRGMTQEKYRRAKHEGDDALTIKGALRPDQIEDTNIERTPTGIMGVDLLGGQDEKNPDICGFCVGDLVLVGGEPGVGKTKLLLKAAAMAASPMSGQTVLYNQGEFLLPTFKKKYCQGVLEGDESLYLSDKRGLGEIIDLIYALKPRFVFLDSKDKINECVNQAGWKRTEKRLRKVAAELGCTIFIVTHLNQEGGIMGGRGIEHDVDVVIHIRNIPEAGVFEAVVERKNRSGAAGDDRKSIFRHLGRGVICVKEAPRYNTKGIVDEAVAKNPLLETLPESVSVEEGLIEEEGRLLDKINASGIDSLTVDERKRLGDISEWRVHKDDPDVQRKLKEQQKARREEEKAKRKEEAEKDLDEASDDDSDED
jgi:hypothetical protein